MRTPRCVFVGIGLAILSQTAHATIFTNTRSEIAQMAGWWEVDSVQISSLVTNQYPALGTNTWEYIFPNSFITSGDGDIHINMAIDSSGTGKNGNNLGSASPIVAEVVNATGSQLSHLQLSSLRHSKTRGIFRFYTEHSSERHFEIHPMTELLTNNGPNSFGLDTNYRPNITNVSDGASHPNSTLINVFNGSDVITTTVLADNNRVTINSPAPSVNYVQYAGVALSALTNDSVSPYFWFSPTLVSATVRCRIITNTLAATAAAGLFSNQTLTINALTRTDMLVVSNEVAALSYPSNPTANFARPVELIALSITNTGVATLPIITDVQATSVTETSAVVQWTTDVPSDSRAIYGLTTLTVTNSVNGSGTVTFHTVNLTGLVASTVYYFDVSSASPAGRTTDDNGEQHYIFITAGPFDLPLTPASGLTSSGNPGGPFTPTNQIYTLSNTNGSSASWSATKNALWLDVSPTNGLLAAGNSTNIAVSINANANSQSAGSYSDFVVFRNLTSGSLTSRLVRLTVFPLPTLAVTPSSGFDSAGPPGGPFSPPAQNYTLSNLGSNTLSWTVGKAANWLDLSATSGSLPPGASTTVTVSINTNANSLAANSYADTVTFTNTTNGIGNTTRGVNLYVTSFGFYDDFSTFQQNSNLVGQTNWTELPDGFTGLPLQVTNGVVAIPYGQMADHQDAYKDFTLTNITVFYGMTLTVTQTVIGTTTSPPYFTALYTSNNAAGFANYRLTAKRGDAGQSNFVFMVRITGQAADFWTQGAILSTGTQYRLIVQTSLNGSNATIYVNPTSSDLASQIPYNSHTLGAGAAPPPSVGGFTFSQLAGFVSQPTVGALIGKAVVADNFTTAYNALLGEQPPVAIFTGNPTIGAEPLAVTFTDTSTGTITNRLWDFGDSSTTNTTTNSVAHAYSAGTYSVTLVVAGPGGVSTNIQGNYIQALTPFQVWQIQYFGSTSGAADANADPDGDGQNNLAEYLIGTDPTNTVSTLRIQSIAREANNLRITWTMGSGRTNAAQFSPGTGGSYNTNFSDIFIVTNTIGTVTNFLDLGAATNTPAGYYRIRLVP